MKKVDLYVVLVLLCSMLLTLNAVAQIQNGQLGGTVADQSGAAVANAKVTAINLGTNLSLMVATDESGSYVFKELPIGVYRVSAEGSGFKTATDNSVTINAGTEKRMDFRLQLGQAREVVEVNDEAATVNTEDSKLATTVASAQISNLPLNGRNVYDLMQLAPGAVNVMGVDFEGGHNTVVNGLREDFNGFLINGVANKALMGGVVNTPIQDTVQEFQQLGLNVSAQYGNSAGSINNLVTKSGTNNLHGSVWDYARNDALDANEFFVNQAGSPRLPLRFNQFGGTLGGALIKDKLFFLVAYQGDRFKTSGTPQSITIESPQWRQAVAAAEPNSVAALLYNNFAPAVPGTPKYTLDQYLGGGVSASSVQPEGFTYSDYLCPDFVGATLATKFQSLFGVTAADQAAMSAPLHSTGAPCSAIPNQQTGSIGRNTPFLNSSVAVFGSQTQTLGNLFNGNEASARLDYNWDAKNRLFLQFNWLKSSDSFGPCSQACTRGFANPSRNIQPTGQFSYVHIFSSSLLNEFRAGYTQNNIGQAVLDPGVPQVLFDDNSVGFGSYNAYPEFFKEHQYTYGDIVSVNHGKHNIKAGVDIKRNIENSEFDVARGSYYFFDPLFFAADTPYKQASGVDPGFASGAPAQLADNIRHFRNLEFGTYFQDDWKATKRLTLNLGLRYDLFTRHVEEKGLATTFLLGPGSNITQQVLNANAGYSTATSGAGFLSTCNPSTVSVPNSQVLAGVCGPGGFAHASSLGPGDHTDFGPRLGFAWDVFGDGKTSLRGGFGISYDGSVYTELSDSRWNPPYYAFGTATNALGNYPNPATGQVVYGPSACSGGICSPSPSALPSYTGPPTNPGQGTGVQATGNLNGWAASNPLLARLTGIVLNKDFRDPYAENFFLSLQRQLANKLMIEVDYVGTMGRHLPRAQDINRAAGGRLPNTACLTNNVNEQLCGLTSTLTVPSANTSGRLNPNYATLRTWEDVVNSDYNALQLQVKKQVSHGLFFNASYTYSHAIDSGSTWHSGGTTANGAAAGDAYSTDQTLPGLDRGNSLFDIRQRLVFNYVWAMPGKELHGLLGAAVGGWQLNGIWAFQSGAHWSPYDGAGAHLTGSPAAQTGCYAVPFVAANCQNVGGDFNLDGVKNDRPNSSLSGFSGFSSGTWANGWATGGQSGLPALTSPCLGCVGNLGRNTFVGPGQWYADMALGKTFAIGERLSLKFEAQAFNIFNRANFILATTGGGAHNNTTDSLFGAAAGTLNSRNLQLGLHLAF
jgi:hypothetical protein